MADGVPLAKHHAGRIRKEFPILGRKMNDHPLIYLDSAASTQKPGSVIAAMTGFMENNYANVHRGLYGLANEATDIYESTRKRAQSFLNAAHDSEIVLTFSGTDAINLVAYGLAGRIAPGDEIMLSIMEHHANIVPWHFLRERYGAVLKWIEITEDGRLDMDSFHALLSPRTQLVALTHMSNVLGTIPDIAAVSAAAAEVGAKTLIDGCQAGAHLELDVQALDVDYYVLTGHKLYGPTGIGVLYGRAASLEALSPWRGGGEMIDKVSCEHITYQAPPYRFEAGTPPIIEAAGLGAALDFISGMDLPALADHEHALRQKALGGLADMGVRTFGPIGKDAGPIVSFAVPGVHPHDISQLLDRQGIAVRAGHHCAQPLMQRLGVDALVRVSFAAYNDEADIEHFLGALQISLNMLKQG